MTQPADWRRAAGLVAAHAAILPQPGERVVEVGCGTSLHMAQAYAAAREAAGVGETDAFPASELPAGRRYDRVVAISRSGTTSEVVRLLAGIPPGAPSLVITAVAGSPCAERATAAIVLGFADEESVVQTRFATTALALLLASIGVDVGPEADAADRVLVLPVPDVTGHGRFAFLGAGWTVGLANEAALKLREAAGMWTEAYQAMEYRHGPVAVTSEASVVWMFGPPPDGLAAEIATAGGTVWLGEEDPLAELVRVQMLAIGLARARGLDPDRPRNLTRSVILA